MFEVLAAFQNMIQGISENLILLDREEYLLKRGIHCTVYKVASEEVSPRCLALVAKKPSVEVSSKVRRNIKW